MDGTYNFRWLDIESLERKFFSPELQISELKPAIEADL